MKRLLLAFVLLTLSPPLWAAEPIGRVADLEGEAWLLHPPSKPTQASMGQTVYLGDSVKTADPGGVKILFIDDTVLIVKENSNVFISEFLFNPQEKKRKVVFDASLGRIRALVGKFFAKDQPVEIRTPTAVAGIRGTDVGCHAQVQSTVCYCFFCKPNVFYIFNSQSPKQVVSLVTNQAIEISKDIPASKENIESIPENILQNKEQLFDIQKGSSAKAVDEVSQEEGKKAAQEGMAAEKEGKSLIDRGAASQKKENELLGSTPSTSDADTKSLPGGTQEISTGTTVTLTLPK